MAPTRTEQANLGLMLLAFGAAMRWPFETLLAAYVVLGPLHYLTEIAWLQRRGYFLRSRTDALPLIGLTALAAFIAFAIGAGARAERLTWVQDALILGTLALAAVLALLPDWRVRAGMLAVALPAAAGLAALPWGTVAAAMLVTLVHVYVFTGLLMAVGMLRRDSGLARAALALFLLLPVLAVALPAGLSMAPGAFATQAYSQAFAGLNVLLLQQFGVALPVDVVFEHPAGVLAARVMAFAYLYHYLNWFVKVEVIGWARLSQSGGIAVGTLWMGMLGLYAYDFLFGFVVLITLSLAHVLLEFPLNAQSLIQLGSLLRRGRQAA